MKDIYKPAPLHHTKDVSAPPSKPPQRHHKFYTRAQMRDAYNHGYKSANYEESSLPTQPFDEWIKNL